MNHEREPPKGKMHQQKAVTKKERERLVKGIDCLLLSVTISYCLDTTHTKLKDRRNPLVIQFALVFEASDIHFLVKFLKKTFVSLYSSCAAKKEKKSMSFHFQWYQCCSILLVEDTAGLAKLRMDPKDDDVKSQVKTRQQWVNFYHSRKVQHEIAKIFMFS